MPWKKNEYGESEYEFTSGAMRDAGSEMLSWLPSEQREYVDLVLNLVGSLPGGDDLADAGYNQFQGVLGWQEMDMIAKLFEAIETQEDVQEFAEAVSGPPEEDEF